MPELPEAESIARALDRALKRKKITGVEVFFPRLRTSLEPLKQAGLEGRRFKGCRRRARYAVADLDDGRALTMHFGMSGVVRVEDAGVRNAKRILRLAIKWGGTTVSDFKNVDGSEGKFVRKLRMYGKRNCPKCGTPVAKVTLGGRTSWYCPECQK